MIREELRDVVKKSYEQGYHEGFNHACDAVALALTEATNSIVTKLKERVKDIKAEFIDEHEGE